MSSIFSSNEAPTQIYTHPSQEDPNYYWEIRYWKNKNVYLAQEISHSNPSTPVNIIPSDHIVVNQSIQNHFTELKYLFENKEDITLSDLREKYPDITNKILNEDLVSKNGKPTKLWAHFGNYKGKLIIEPNTNYKKS